MSNCCWKVPSSESTSSSFLSAWGNVSSQTTVVVLLQIMWPCSTNKYAFFALGWITSKFSWSTELINEQWTPMHAYSEVTPTGLQWCLLPAKQNINSVSPQVHACRTVEKPWSSGTQLGAWRHPPPPPKGPRSYSKGSMNHCLPASPLPSPSPLVHECAEGKMEMFLNMSPLSFWMLENGCEGAQGGGNKELWRMTVLLCRELGGG